MSIELKYTPSGCCDGPSALESVTIVYDDEIWSRGNFIAILNKFISFTGNDFRVCLADADKEITDES